MGLPVYGQGSCGLQAQIHALQQHNQQLAVLAAAQQRAYVSQLSAGGTHAALSNITNLALPSHSGPFAAAPATNYLLQPFNVLNMPIQGMPYPQLAVPAAQPPAASMPAHIHSSSTYPGIAASSLPGGWPTAVLAPSSAPLAYPAHLGAAAQLMYASPACAGQSTHTHMSATASGVAAAAAPQQVEPGGVLQPCGSGSCSDIDSSTPSPSQRRMGGQQQQQLEMKAPAAPAGVRVLNTGTALLPVSNAMRLQLQSQAAQVSLVQWGGKGQPLMAGAGVGRRSSLEAHSSLSSALLPCQDEVQVGAAPGQPGVGAAPAPAQQSTSVDAQAALLLLGLAA
jgi:hypothetical protein